MVSFRSPSGVIGAEGLVGVAGQSVILNQVQDYGWIGKAISNFRTLPNASTAPCTGRPLHRWVRDLERFLLARTQPESNRANLPPSAKKANS